MTAAASLQHDLISPFAGADVCRQAGLALPDGARRPAFEHDLWDFTDVVGLPVDMSLANRRLDFSAIADPGGRLVAKELVLAMLAPRHPAVAKRLPVGLGIQRASLGLKCSKQVSDGFIERRRRIVFEFGNGVHECVSLNHNGRPCGRPSRQY